MAYSYGSKDEILCSLMVKRSILKSSRVIHIDNFKSRWFVLTSKYLKYCDGTLEVRGCEIKRVYGTGNPLLEI